MASLESLVTNLATFYHDVVVVFFYTFTYTHIQICIDHINGIF